MAVETKNYGDLAGKVVLITGASSGLGREFAVAMAKKGCNVVVTARSSSEAHIDLAVAKAWHAFGSIDILVNNAGYRGSVKSPLHYEEEEWNTVINTNLRGAWLVSKAIGNRMRDAGKKGSIINISSTASVNRGDLPGSIIYTISKVGLNRLTTVMALELGRYGIRVNAIAAGMFKSEITKGLFEKDWPHKVAEKIVPAQRFGSTDPDLTNLLLLLASNSSSYVTGNIFIVDGGQSIPGFPLWSSL